MHEDGEKLLKLMFKPEETVCLSPNKYGYHSIPLENAFCEEITLVSPDIEKQVEYCGSDEIQLVALNPIEGFRVDANCYRYRNFLVEMDVGPLSQQLDYVKKMGMPYSAVVFSGGKSLHFLISLSEDLPNEEAWRKISEWILAILPLADQNCKNPSRSIRLPGAARGDKRQALVEYHGEVANATLKEWLMTFHGFMPKDRVIKEIDTSGDLRFKKLKKWARDVMKYGPKKTGSRNKQWFAVACEYALAGFSEDDTLDILGARFIEDRDFKKKEWKTAIKSGFKHIYETRKYDTSES